MNTKKLKQLVLDLAIHGKLVPQDPNDEPASELLKRIVETHGRASNIGRASKQTKTKSAISSDNLDDVPFEVPEGWCWTIVKNICSKIGSGSTPRGSNYSDEGIPFFRSQNIYNEGLVYDDIKYISEETHLSMIGTEVKANDILLNITGGSLGRCAVVPNDFKRGNVSQHVCILRTIEVLPSYLHSFIISDFFSDTMILSGSGREGLPKYSLEAMPIPIPPLSEQKRIVAEVEKWFGIIDQLESNEADLRKSIEQTKKKVLDLAIHGKLVPQDPNDEPASELLKRIVETHGRASNKKSAISSEEIDEVPFEVPKGWVWTKFGLISNVVRGGSPRPAGSELYYNGSIPFMKVADITKDDGMFVYSAQSSIKEAGLKKTRLIDVNTLVISNSGATLGVPKITKFKTTINDGVAAFEGFADEIKFFAYWYLKTLTKSLRNIDQGAAQPNLNTDLIKDLFIPLPPLSEQKRIVAKIEEVFGELDRIEEMIG